MARARNIKPGFFKNEDLAECTLAARLCFAGLWTLADRAGRLEDRPKRIKGELFAFDSIEVESLLGELQDRGFLVRYRNSDGSFIQISKFSTHQTPHYSEKPSVIKPPQLLESGSDDGIENPGTLQEDSKKEAVLKRGAQPPDSLIPDSLIPDSLIPEEEISAPSALVDRFALNGHGPPAYRVPDCPYAEILASFHEALPTLPHVVVFNDARKASLRARWIEVCAAEKFDRDEGLRWFGVFFRMLGRSAFLTGRAGKWRASFDWLTQPRNFAKAVEGNYQEQTA